MPSFSACLPLSSARDCAVEFDYSAIDEALAAEPSKRPRTPNEWDDPQPENQAEADAAFEAMRTTLWLLAGACLPEGNHIDVRTVGLRLVAMLFLSSPQEFGCGSAKALAEKCGVSRQSLTQHIETFRAAYGIRSRNQLSADTRAKYSAAQSRAWARRRELARAAADAVKESATG